MSEISNNDLSMMVLNGSSDKILSVIIAMGSNFDSTDAFCKAKIELATLGRCTFSDVVVGRDFTGKTDLIYHNACVKIELNMPWCLADLEYKLKAIERICGRECSNNDKNGGNSHRQIVTKVAMDLDLLAIYANEQDWQILPKRLPFKEHEKAGLRQVAMFLL